jgi:hypothetical protein
VESGKPHHAPPVVLTSPDGERQCASKGVEILGVLDTFRSFLNNRIRGAQLSSCCLSTLSLRQLLVFSGRGLDPVIYGHVFLATRLYALCVPPFLGKCKIASTPVSNCDCSLTSTAGCDYIGPRDSLKLFDAFRNIRGGALRTEETPHTVQGSLVIVDDTVKPLAIIWVSSAIHTITNQFVN